VPHSFDIITPIHINHPTLKIGSNSLFDNTKIQALALPVSGPDLSKAKAWVSFDQINNKILSSNNVAQVLTVSAGIFQVFFIKPFKNTNYITIASGGQNVTITEHSSLLKNTNCVTLIGVDYNGGTASAVRNYAAFFGELLDEV